MLSMRKQIISNILLCLLAALIAGCSGRLAESGLQGSVRLVVVRGRGGSADIVARAFAPYFQEELGVEVVVENVEGGAGKVGLTQVYYAKPDGRTLVLGNFPSYVLSQELENGVFHDISEFEPIVGISGNEGNVLVASNDSPYNSLEELLEYDRAHRGQLHMAVTSGISNSSLAQTMLVSQTGLSATAFPHDDGNSCVKAVVSKRVNLAVCSGAAAQRPFAERAVKVLCTFGVEEDAKFPGVPSFSAAYGAEYGYDVIMGVLAPPGTDESILAKLREAGLSAALRSDFTAAAGDKFNVAARDHIALADAISSCYRLTEASREYLSAD